MRRGLIRMVGLLTMACSLYAPGTPALAQSVAASGTPIPYRQETQTTADLSWRVLLGLLVCAGLAGGAVYVVRRRFPGLVPLSSTGQLQVIETRRLDTKRSLYVVQWHGAQLLVGAGEGGIVLLARKTDDAGISAIASPYEG